MEKSEVRLMKKKYRNNYIARFAWSAVMLVIVYFKFGGLVLALTASHLALSAAWIVLVETESPVIFIEDTRFIRIAMDAFLYTLAIYVTGGINSFCLLSYIIFVMLSSLYSTNKYGIFAIVSSIAFYNAMLLLVHLEYIPSANFLFDDWQDRVGVTRASVLFTNFLLVFVAVIMNVTAHTLYRNLMDRTRELQVERNRLHERNRIIENDLKLARKIQEQLIPPHSPYPSVYALYKPMEQVGGDLYDFLSFRDSSRIGIFLSDVSGHGVPAAFITSMIKTMILQSGSAREDPAALLMYLNGLLHGKTAENFVTAFYGIFDTRDRTLVYSNAGHNPPYLIGEGAVTAINEARSMPLAIADNEFLERAGKKYSVFRRTLDPGDRLLFYTDGLVEEDGGEGDYLSFEDLMLREILPGQKGASARSIVEGLHARLERWSGSGSFTDDVCIVCLEV